MFDFFKILKKYVYPSERYLHEDIIFALVHTYTILCVCVYI